MEMNSPHDKAVQAILYGHSCAMRLKMRLDHFNMAESGPVSSYDLAKSIVDCFSNAISILSVKPKSEDEQFSDLSSRDSSPPPPQGSPSKKRKIESTNSSANWRDDSPDPIYYDGYLWRKYGQKCIKKSAHQRSYYRCSYNIDHNCGARKHEQKIKDNPPVYRTTYFGQHTCKTNHNLDAIFTAVQGPLDDSKSAKMIRFGKDLDQEKEHHSNGFSLSVKHEEEESIREQTMDQYHEIASNNQDCQHVIKEDLSSPSDSYPPPSSSGSESAEFDSDLLFDNPDWDRFDQFYF
ncbi:PREDICTED: probable WRKY transcription factor 38 [Camelina sativa]|uniref:Probable WRKY transcription factor 38 n=1 Tax=Camelina sativa TaxID=90675 RepID=A0ABM0T580_CAMSA|nr:PREDICTED: probable WRKY transcription factor 38 [Camelina sativa]